jgi:hypothetical protein
MDPIIKYITNVEALKFLVRIISYVYDNSINVVHCSWMKIICHPSFSTIMGFVEGFKQICIAQNFKDE